MNFSVFQENKKSWDVSCKKLEKGSTSKFLQNNKLKVQLITKLPISWHLDSFSMTASETWLKNIVMYVQFTDIWQHDFKMKG